MTRRSAARRKPDRPLYDVLGVDPAASSDEIKSRYRAKAKSAHPDAGGNAEAFRAIARTGWDAMTYEGTSE